MMRLLTRLLIQALAGVLMLTTAVAVQAACRADLGELPTGFAKQAHAGQVLVPAGWVRLGTEDGYPDERPAAAPVQVKAFWMDRTEVTNAQFAAFVKATGHVTDAEKQGGGAVFELPTPDALRERPLAWWRFVPGANWRHPKGPGSDLRGHWAEPVVLVTQADALAYARWLGHDLPTEAEWEHAAKAGRNDRRLDAAPTDPRGRPTANYWQGSFPLNNLAQDGFAGLAPVGCYAANRWGLHDLIGNAWEWTRDVQPDPIKTTPTATRRCCAPAWPSRAPELSSRGAPSCVHPTTACATGPRPEKRRNPTSRPRTLAFARSADPEPTQDRI